MLRTKRNAMSLSESGKAAALPAMLLAAITLCATVSTVAADPLVQVSGDSPFGALNGCGDDQSAGGSTNFLDSEVEPWVAVNPANTQNIVAFWQQDRWSDGGDRSNVAGVSTDGGKNWQIVAVPGLTECSGNGDFKRASDPWVTFSPDGTLHQMSLVININPPPDRPGGLGRGAMVVSKSTDGGFTWSNPIALIDDADPRIINDKNAITADPHDANFVYAIWDRIQTSAGTAIAPEISTPAGQAGKGNFNGVASAKGLKSPIYFTRTTDGGDTWEKPRIIYDAGANNDTLGTQIVVQPNGTLVNFFTEVLANKGNTGNGPGFSINLSLLYSTDRGETWLPRGKPIRAAQRFTEGAVTPDDEIAVRDGSILFDVAVDPNNGALYAVWQDTRFNDIEEVAFSKSTDGGLTWSAPIKVNQTPVSTDNALRDQAIIPSVEVNDAGIIAITYYDFRNDVDDDMVELADHFAILCDPVTAPSACAMASDWGFEIVLTEASFNYLDAPFARGVFVGDYQGLATDGADFMAVFSQPHGDDPASIFFRRFAMPAP